MHRQTQALLSLYDITADQYVLLALLNEEDGIIQSELTQRASSDPNTVRAMLVLMEKKGLVIRKSADADRRVRRVIITAKGRGLQAELNTVLRPLQDELLAPFSEKEAKALTLALQRVVRAMYGWETRQRSSDKA